MHNSPSNIAPELKLCVRGKEGKAGGGRGSCMLGCSAVLLGSIVCMHTLEQCLEAQAASCTRLLSACLSIATAVV